MIAGIAAFWLQRYKNILKLAHFYNKMYQIAGKDEPLCHLCPLDSLLLLSFQDNFLYTYIHLYTKMV